MRPQPAPISNNRAGTRATSEQRAERMAIPQPPRSQPFHEVRSEQDREVARLEETGGNRAVELAIALPEPVPQRGFPPLPVLDPGDFGRANQPVSSPAHAQQPTTRGCDWWRPFGTRARALLPAIEPRARRRCVHAVPQLASQRRSVSSGVQQDVGNRSADFEGRLQHSHVVSIGQDRAAAPEDPMHGTRQARSDRLHASAQGSGVVSLDDQVRVIALQRVVDEPEVAPVAGDRERTLDFADELRGSERRDTRPHLQGDMTREARSDTGCPTSVPNAGSRSRFATGSWPPTAPARSLAKREFELRYFL